MGTQDNLNDLRVASFSCYLKPIEGVANMFDAGDMAVLDLHKLNPNMFTARTPSISASEASSWSNNQTALLQRSSLSQAKSSNGRGFGKRWFHVPCTTRKAVYVHQSIKQGDQFAFPVLNPAIQIFKTEEKKEKVVLDELPRMSLEVFGSGTINKGDIARNLVRKMSILTWDAIPKSKESVICDDMASEASSDLFEIENISRAGWTSQPCDHRCDVMSPSTQYAPSEASIEWSVVTASAAEFSSMYSGYDGKHTIYNSASKIRTSTKTKIGPEPVKKSQKTLANGLLGCKSYKSVKVAEPVYRTIDKTKH